MRDWLKFFGLSFFSDKIAKDAKTRGVMNCVLGFVLTLVFIFCGVLAANTAPFNTHYNNSSSFKSLVRTVVSETDVSVANGQVSADKQVNTKISADDKAVFGNNGYTVVVDTRPSTALDDFDAYCASKDGSGEITYEEYLDLPDEDKRGYDFGIRFTPKELVLTDALVDGYGEYLSSCDDESAVKQYNELTESKGGMTADEYRLKVYALYIKTYYPDISAFERASDVPLLRSYYYRNYLNSNDIEKSLFIFSDVLFGFFDTDKGLSITFYGSYGKAESGTLTADNVDAFIKSVFRSSVSASSNIYLMNTCKYIPLIVLIPLVLALLSKLVFVLTKKKDGYEKLSVCLKVECTYLAVGALLTAIIEFVCGFFLSSNVLNSLPLIVYGAVLTVRTAVYLVVETLNDKRAAKQTSDDGATPEA